jgi:hypothetical protein
LFLIYFFLVPGSGGGWNLRDAFNELGPWAAAPTP